MKPFPLLALTVFWLISSALTPLHAKEQLEIKEYGLITPPACIVDSNREIKVYPGTSEQIVNFGGFLAAAGDFEVGKDGGIVHEDRIYFDESNMPFLHPLLQEFLFRHECAHVKLDHLDIPRTKRLGRYWDIEKGADCQALLEMKQDSPDFSQEAESILQHFNLIANAIMPAPPGKEAVKQQFIDQRIANMRKCNAFQS